MSGWISANKSPKQYSDYIVYIEKTREVTTAFFKGDGWRITSPNFVLRAPITHWRELPKPPRK